MWEDRPSALRCAFVLLRARPGAPLPHDAVRRLPERPDLPFEPGPRLVWRDTSGTTLVAAWQEDAPPDRRRWLVDGRGLLLTTGRVRAKGARWTPPHRWAGQVARRLRDEPVESVLDALTGEFHVLAVDADGTGVLAGDPLGYAFTFHASADDVDVLASTASLAAAASTPADRTPERDVLSTIGLVYAPYHLGTSTGYAGVELLREGAIARLAPGERPHIGGRPAPWLDRAPLASLDRDALLDRVVADAADEIVAATQIDADEHVVDLTGGKDSRLLLAVVLLAGLARKVRFTTFGPETLADVRIARTIADRFDLDHRWGLDEHAPAESSYVDDVRAFAAITNGTVNVWHAKRRNPPTGRVRVSGSFAELLRTHQVVRGASPSIDQIVRRQVARFRERFLPLLDDEAAAHLDTVAIRELRDDPIGGSEPLDLFETFFARNRTRSFWGPLFDLEPDERSWPLVSVDTVRAAFAVGGQQRQLERVHFDLIRRASEDLVDIPFAGAGWSPALERRPAPDPSDAPPDGPRPSGAPMASPANAGRRASGRDEALIGLMRRTANPARRAFVEEVLSDRSSAVWDVVDRPATVAAVERWDQLTGAHRQQVFGVVTALLWLG